MFAELEPDLVATCSACHEAGGIADTPFLAAPDRYTSMVSWPGVVTKDPQKSVLLTYPLSGGKHSGVNLDSEELAGTDLAARIEAWLAEEARAIGDGALDAGRQIDPFTPIFGFNAVYLDALGSEYSGMALTFTANEIAAGALELAELEVHPTAKLGVHVVHPLFVVYASEGGPDPDPVDSFSNVDQTFDVGAASALGPGAAILTNWKPGAKLSVAFERIEPYGSQLADGGDEGGIGGGCKDVDAFAASAAPPLSASCVSCHGGANPQAKSAVDMSQVDTNPAAACAQVRNRVNPGNPPASQLFVTTDPGGNAAHPFKFGGNAGSFNDFEGSVSTWIAAEK
jgi:hypothetical protein